MTQFQIARPMPAAAPDRITEARLNEERARFEPRGFLGTAADAINSEWSTSWLYRWFGRRGFETDPDFILDRPTFDRLAEGLPDDMLGELADARSEQHAARIREQLTDVADARQRLSAQGWNGTGARMLAAVGDPVDIGIGVIGGALGGPEVTAAVAAKKAARISRMIKLGLIGAGANIPNQLLISSLDPEQNALDVLYAAAGGFIGGNLGGVFDGPPLTRLGAIGRGAGIGGATGAAVSLGATTISGEFDPATVATATLFGAGAGTVGAALTRGMVDRAGRMQDEIKFRDTVDAAMGAASAGEFRRTSLREQLEYSTLSEGGRVQFRRELDPVERQGTIDRLIELSGMDAADDAEAIGRLRSLDPDDALAELHGRLSTGSRFTALGGFTDVKAGGRTLPARYALVELDDLVTSHDPRARSGQGGFARTAGGPPNERQYHNVAEAPESILAVLQIERNPDLRILTADAPTPEAGPPIVDPESGWVLGGNARTMGMRLAYERDAGTLKDGMVAAAGKFGLSADTAATMRQPVVVRLLDDAGDPVGLSKLLNATTSAGRSASTIAASSAANVSADTADIIGRMLTPTGDEEAPTLREVLSNPEQAHRIARRLVTDGAWDNAELARHWDNATGRLTPGGKVAIEQLLVARILDDADLAAAIPPSVAERLLAASAPLLRAQASSGEGRRLRAMVQVAALRIVERRAQAEKPSIDDLIFGQTRLDTPPGQGSLPIALLVHGLETMPARKFREAMENIAQDVTGGEGTMFAGEATPLVATMVTNLGPGLDGPNIRAAAKDPAAFDPAIEALTPDTPRPAGGVRFRPATAPTDFEIRVAELMDSSPDLTLSEARISTIRTMRDDYDRSAGRDPARAPIDPPEPPAPTAPKQPGDLDLTWATPARASWRFIRRSFASILGGSVSPEVRLAATAMADDALLKEDGTGTRVAASTWTHRETQRRLAGWRRTMDNSLGEWLSDRKVSIRNRRAESERFAREVGEAVRSPAGTFTDPHINAAADATRRILADTLETAKRHGVRGLENVETADTYLRRVWNPQQLNRATQLHGDDAVRRLFAQAIREGSGLEEGEAAAVANAMLRTVRDLDKYVDADKSRLAAGEAPELLREILEAEGWSPEKIQNTLDRVTPRGDKGGDVGPAKRRALMDEHAAIDTPAGTLRLMDLMDSDVNRIVPGYVRQMLGAAAASEVYRVVGGPDRIEPIRTFQQMKDRLVRRMNAAGMKPQQVEKELGLLETLDRHVRGLPLARTTTATTIMRRLRGLNYVRLAGQFGFAQIPEMAGIVAEGGLRATLASVPSLGRIFRKARSGVRLDDDLLATLEMATGLGTDRLLNRFNDRMEDATGAVEQAGEGVDRLLHGAMRLSGDLSGMSQINMASQRLAAVAAVQKWWGYASSGRTPSAKRLATMGFSEDQGRRIVAAMREEADAGRGVKVVRGPLFGRRVADIDFGSWRDQDAAAMLVDGIDRWARRVIQHNDIGNLHPWMVTDLGRTLLQFRTFTIAAWEKQLLHRLQTRDLEAFTSASFGMTLAGIVYAAQTQLQSIGEPDREEFLRKRLSTSAIARAAFARSASSSLLPSVIDTGAFMAGEGPYFSFRQTGLSNQLLSVDSTPTAQLVNTGFQAGRGVLTSARTDRQFDRQDFNAAASLLPFQQVLGIRNVLRSYAATLPERDEQ